MKKKILTIGMPVYDDYDGAYFSIQAIRLYHSEILHEVELVLLDTHPGTTSSDHLHDFAQFLGNDVRLISSDEQKGTAASRNELFHQAQTDFVLIADCHVLFLPGALRHLIDYCLSHPDTNNLLQGPLMHDSLRYVSTHMSLCLLTIRMDHGPRSHSCQNLFRSNHLRFLCKVWVCLRVAVRRGLDSIL